MNTTKKVFNILQFQVLKTFLFVFPPKIQRKKKRSIQAALISKSGEKYVDNCFQQSTSNMLKT